MALIEASTIELFAEWSFRVPEIFFVIIFAFLKKNMIIFNYSLGISDL